MIFVLGLWLGLATPARAHLNLSNGSRHLRGSFERTDRTGVVRYVPNDQEIDLTAFGTRAAALCDVVLNSKRVILNNWLERAPDMVIEQEQPRVERANARYGVVTTTDGVVTLCARAATSQPDQLFSPLPAGTAAITPTGPVTAHLDALVHVAGQLSFDVAPRTLIASGKLGAEGDFRAESLSLPLDLGYLDPHFVTIARGEILATEAGLVMRTPHGRRFRLVNVPGVAGTEEACFIDHLDYTAIGPDRLAMGFEVDGELRVFIRR